MSKAALSDSLPDSAAQRQIKLLIIEDDNVHRMIIKRFAAALGFATTEAPTYEQAITLFDQDMFDCITLDLSIHSRSGLDVLRHLRDIGCKIPVLIISGAEDGKRSETLLVAESMHFHILHVMKKPLDLHALRAALAKLKTFVHVNGQGQP